MKFPCPHCHQSLEAAEEHQGLKADCGLCGGAFTVPVPGSAATKIAGIDAGELLARGLNTIQAPDSTAWEPPTPEELARLLPQYRIESIIGRGGMGAVYKGSQERLARHVAIKLLPAELTEDPNFVSRFEREARTLAKLDHPGIIHIHDFGQTAEGHLYFVMEFVDGTDLHQLIHGSGINAEQALEIITQVCDALQFAHSKGVVHRDIKPANILVTRDGRVKLADFGLARPLQTGQSGQLTLSRVVMGTPDYMAPEQKRGEGDHRVDLYALGVMLYEMLCGRTPQGAWQPPSQRVSVDVRLDQVVIKAMQEEPERRYQQASEVKTDVEKVRTTLHAPATPRDKLLGKRSTPQAARQPSPHQPAAASHVKTWMLGAFILIIGGLGLWQLSGFTGNSKVPPSLSATGDQTSPGTDPAASTPSHPATVRPTLEAVRAACAEWRTLPGWNDHRIRRDKDGRIDLLLVDLPIHSLAPLAKCRGADFGYIDLNRVAIDDLSPLEGSTIQGLYLRTAKLSSLKPLRHSGLKSLDLMEMSSLTSLEGLEGLPLQRLIIFACPLKDLAPLASGNTLSTVRLQAAGPLRDLSPLATHPIRELNLRDLPLASLRGIETMPLEKVSLTKVEVNDLSALGAKPLQTLKLDRVHRYADFSPLLQCPDLRVIDFPDSMFPDFSPQLEPLRQLKLERIGGLEGTRYWSLWDEARSHRDTIEELAAKLKPYGYSTAAAEVPQVTFAPPAGLRVRLMGSRLTDLTLLSGYPVAILETSDSLVTDISAASSLPLRALYLGRDGKVADLTPLESCTELESIELCAAARNLEPLRKLPRLKYISYEWQTDALRPAQTAEEFWRMHPPKK
jgi:serine/threonine protein kinase